MRVLVVNTGSSSLKLHVHDVAEGGTPGGEPTAGQGADAPGGGATTRADEGGTPGAGRSAPAIDAGVPARPIVERHIEGWDGHDTTPIAAALREVGHVDAVGHRVVHGGDRHEPAQINDDLLRRLGDLTALAPLHQGRALAGILAAQAVVPKVPQVACFDTMYHATLSEAAVTYALPAEWRQRWPLRRYGFHGLSHAYAARRAAELRAAPARRDVAPGDSGGRRGPTELSAEAREAAGLDAGGPARSGVGSQGSGGRHGPTDRETGGLARSASPADQLRVVTCHLGAGASLCASRGGRAVDTTMGFTPLEGLVMATRAGSVDPGLVLWLITEAGLTPDTVRRGLERSSGLAGLAGTSDMRGVLDRRRVGDRAARLAFDVYVHALCRHIGAMTASLGGLDALVFTGGVGEHAPDVRVAAADRLTFLGVAVDPGANRAAVEGGDHDVTAPAASVATLVIEAREDMEIAHKTSALLAGRTGAVRHGSGSPKVLPFRRK